MAAAQPVAAIAAPPPAALPAIGVTIDAPQSDDVCIYLDSQEPMVLASPCAGWVLVPPAAAGGQARASLPTYKALRAFARRCVVGPNAADMAMARQTSVLGFALVAAAWSRILSELRDSGLFNSQSTYLRDLEVRLSGLRLLNPANLQLLAADFLAVAPFNQPAPIAPVVGRGRGRGQAAPAVGVPVLGGAAVGPPELRFIHLCSLDKLQDPSSQSPFAAVVLLAGMLGPCLTHAVRADELSTVRTTATILRPNLATHIGLDSATAAGAGSDPALASRLRVFILSAFQSLGGVFCSLTAGEIELQNEAFAAFRYLLGTESQKLAVEIQFMFSINSLCASALSNPRNFRFFTPYRSEMVTNHLSLRGNAGPLPVSDGF